MVRADLTIEQQAVQAIHAGLESGIHASHCATDISSLVLLSVANEDELLRMESALNLAGIQTVLFREPDLGNQATALATGALPSTSRRHFRRHKLWSASPRKDIQ